jgi:hypothetical protein
LTTISQAMDYWFNNNYAPDACLDQGGLDACPCGTPGFWNTNWFGQVIYYLFGTSSLHIYTYVYT